MSLAGTGARKRKPFRHKSLFISLGIIIAIALCLFVFSGILRAALHGLKVGLLDEFRGRTGYQLSYGSISPSFFRFLEFRDLAISDPNGDDQAIVRIEKVRLYYNFFEILFAAD